MTLTTMLQAAQCYVKMLREPQKDACPVDEEGHVGEKTWPNISNKC